MSKKVLIVASTFSHIVSFHLPYVERFHRLGWEVHIACGGDVKEIPNADRLYLFPFEKRISSFSNFRASAAIRKLTLHEEYDLVITHTSLAAFFTRLAFKGMKHRPKTINVVHGYLFDDDTPVMKKLVLEAAELFTAGQTDKILTMNAYDTVWATKHHAAPVVHRIAGMGAAAGKCENLKSRTDYGLSEDDFVLVYPAEFSERKNQRMLIEAMPMLPANVKLLLPGTGDRLQFCRELAERLGVKDRVIFPGYITGIYSVLCLADAAVSSSRSEGFPFNIIEAMLASLPVIASNVKGNADLVEDGVTGMLFPFNDKYAFSKGVESLMENEKLRQSMGTRGKGRAGMFALASVLEPVMNEYLSVL